MEKTLEENYRKCISNIISASDYITKMAIEGDIDKVDLYRVFLNEMVDKAIKIKMTLSHYDEKNK